jgi:hypothetical protein
MKTFDEMNAELATEQLRKTPVTRYKFRAELFGDALCLFNLLQAKGGLGNVCVEDGCLVSFDTYLSEEELAALIAAVPDSHIIEQTIAPESQYTGISRIPGDTPFVARASKPTMEELSRLIEMGL